MVDTRAKTTVLSGIRATGQMHLGNYLGAVQYFVDLAKQVDTECFYFVANLHTITTRPDPLALLRDTRRVVLDYLAAGLDPERTTLYLQSSVPEITELAWILACHTPVNELMRMHHFKEKRNMLEEAGMSANAGLLTYPILMAADILGPLADIVPVGDDQKAHVEMARDLARRFNDEYGQLFHIPEPLVRSPMRVPSLTADGKMGKSESDGAVMLDETADVVREKFRIAVTDPARQRRTDPGDPDICNIYTFHQLVSTKEELTWARNGCQTAGIGCVECKAVVSTHINAILEPMRERRAEIAAKGSGFIDEILHEGGKRARARIKDTVDKAKDMAGVPLL